MRGMLVLVLLAIISSACTTPTTVMTPGCVNGSGDYSNPDNFGYLWLAVEGDNYVHCNNFGAGNTACSTDSTLPPASTNLQIVDFSQPTSKGRIYARFFLPELPSSAQIIAAYANLDTNSINTNQSVVTISGSPAVSNWDPNTISWNSQPNPLQSSQGLFTLRSQFGNWTEAQNMIPLVDLEQMMDGSEPNHGFMFHVIPSGGSNVEINYSSGNHPSRTISDLGDAPRLLIQLSEPVSCADLNLPPLWTNTDLGFTGNVLMVMTEAGTAWPASWEPGIAP